MRLSIERATIAHVNDVAPLFDAYRVFYKEASDLEGSRAFIAERMHAQDSVIFVAYEKESLPVGFVQLYPIFSSARMRRLWLLNDLFVDPSARTHGTGRQLMDAAETFARESGSCGLTLSTAVDNVQAQSLYRACNYQRDDDFYVFNLEFEN